MRIGVDLSVQELPSPTGVERAQAVLLDALLDADADHEYVLFAPRRVPDRWRGHPRVTCVDGPERPTWFWRESVVPRACREQRVDVFHSPVAAVPLRVRAPLLATVHEAPWAEPDDTEGDRSAAHRLRLHLAANFAARILVPSERTARQVAALHPDAEPRVRVVPHGLPAGWARAVEEAPLPDLPDGPLVLAVGRLRAKKNLARLLDAFAARVAAVGDGLLVLAGPDGDAADALRERAARPDLAGRVRLVGHVDDATLAGLYRRADCLAHVSLLEGFGLPLLEAAAAGVPVVAARQGVVPEATGGAAHLVDGEDPDAIARGLAAVLDDPAEADRLRAAGRAHAATATAEAAARAVLAVYGEFA